MATEEEWIFQRAAGELADSTGVDADSVALVLRGLGLREPERLEAFRSTDDVITSRDLHITVRVGDVLVSY